MLTHLSDDWIPIAVIGLGGFMLVVITILHGFGLDRIVARYKRRAVMVRKERSRASRAVFVFAGTIALMLVLHISEISLWAWVLWIGGLVPHYHEAVYFCANTYTTLGMGSMILPHLWHELSPIIAISGLFTFAWTTSEMFNIVGDQHKLVADLSALREGKGVGEPAN